MGIEIVYMHALAGKGSNGKEFIPSSTLNLLVDGELDSVTATGNGPINAIYNAINRARVLKGKQPYLMNFSIAGEQQGSDAAGTAHVKVVIDNTLYEGIGSSTDIVWAAALAYVDALNKMLNNSKKE